MKKYTQPDVKVIFMNSADLITTSSVVVNTSGSDCEYVDWNDLFID